MNFTVGNLQTAQTILDDRFAGYEMRSSDFPVTSLMAGNAPFMAGDITSIRTREDRPAEVHFIARTKRNTGNTRTHNHQGTIDDTAKVQPTWATYTDKTSISLKLLDNSIYNFDEILANKMYQCMLNIMEDIEAANAAWLRTYRTQYSKALKGNVAFNNVTNSVEVTASAGNKARFYQLLRSAMKQNNYKGALDIVADPILAVEAEWLKAQGSGNAANTAFQFGNMKIAESNDLADANYPDGIVIAMPANSVCLLDWIPKQNRNGFGDYMSVLGGFGSMQDPWGFGFQFAVHGYAERANTSAANGDTQDVQMEFEVSIDVSKNKAPLTGNVNESTLYQVGLKP